MVVGKQSKQELAYCLGCLFQSIYFLYRQSLNHVYVYNSTYLINTLKFHRPTFLLKSTHIRVITSFRFILRYNRFFFVLRDNDLSLQACVSLFELELDSSELIFLPLYFLFGYLCLSEFILHVALTVELLSWLFSHTQMSVLHSKHKWEIVEKGLECTKVGVRLHIYCLIPSKDSICPCVPRSQTIPTFNFTTIPAVLGIWPCSPQKKQHFSSKLSLRGTRTGTDV